MCDSSAAVPGSRGRLERSRRVRFDRSWTPNRTVVLAIDGLDEPALERFDDALSTLASIHEEGVSASLESTLPGCRESTWPSLYTGTNPSHHGVFGPLAYDGYPTEARPVSRVDVRRPAIWDYLSSQAARSIVLSVPVSHPADPTTGVLVPGTDAPGGYTHPPGVGRELADVVDRGGTSRSKVGSDHGAWADRLERRGRALRALLESHPWELALCSFPPIPERGVEDDDRYREACEAIDRVAASILESVDEGTTVIVCSTRGRAGRGLEIPVNDVLAEHGYLEWATETNGPVVRDRQRRRPRPSAGGESTILARAKRAVGRLRSRVPVEAAVETCRRGRAGLRSMLEWPGTGRSERAASVAWTRSLAYCVTGAEWGVRVNLAGREPDGRVPPSRYDDVCAELVEILTTLETPTGERAFESVRHREGRYGGPFLERAPDVLCQPAGRNVVAAGPGDDRSTTADRSSASGLFLGRGPGFVGEAPDRLSVTDVAPIALASLERPVPSLMTGRVPDGLLRDPHRARYDGVAVGATTDDPTFDDADVRNRLEWLDSEDGWLE